SINYAIEQLRELVARVATTAESVAASSNETRATSLRLSEASQHQAVQIANASSSINDISENLSKVSENAEQLANTAQRSVTVARNGASVVQNTIEGMNNIREQIQDTSKRIKRLGESSQEIGDIVSLINEIADQTNILALNASIQAAMAGEAGRGFAVVADEVQGLAERAAASTRQIENLVKTIQSDTNEAVASMEQTTAEVVRGAQLANNAGNALNDIQTTSENLATLILAIAKETQNQSQSAESIVGSMRVIQDISAQTLEGTTESARAVGELSEQADELRQSIADFKLPDSMQPESISEADDDELAMGVDDMSFVDDEAQGSNSQEDNGVYDDELIIEEEQDVLAETSSVESYEYSDDDADLDVEFVDDQDININEPETTQASFPKDEEPDESDDFEATMIMEAADLEIDDDQVEQENAPEEKKPNSDKTDTDEDEDDLDFSFDDEDFLSFDLDEEKKK
ncbi:MAG: methyl-accepting chemotaxis protein, partial [Pseudomonadales bacterium]